jgi:1-deoxy-D-xylulose-5-phosphate reductoisomerase
VAEDLPDQIRLIGLAAGGNADVAAGTNAPAPAGGYFDHQTRPRRKELQNALGQNGGVPGDEGLLKLATLPEADIVLIAIVGTAGIATGAGGHSRRARTSPWPPRKFW